MFTINECRKMYESGQKFYQLGSVAVKLKKLPLLPAKKIMAAVGLIGRVVLVGGYTSSGRLIRQKISCLCILFSKNLKTARKFRNLTSRIHSFCISDIHKFA